MTHPLKELLERLMENNDVEVFHDCNVETEVPRLQARLSDLPNEESSERGVLEFGLQHLRNASKSMIKQARKLELELEMRLLEKPDDVDLGSDEYKHARLHVEEDQLNAELLKREGQALQRFCDIVDNMIENDE